MLFETVNYLIEKQMSVFAKKMVSYSLFFYAWKYYVLFKGLIVCV